ncbi:hypothetical protein F383_32430 [Gossypium arboreum]|uniref:Uncharacterized protein n=1 Tax=Gossypium arboreum TaxID=29729 RepID=A0A0B0N3Q1_GOSAR|nr:hypothetical protein F383_32430 [Gossypium arboreum]
MCWLMKVLRLFCIWP